MNIENGIVPANQNPAPSAADSEDEFDAAMSEATSDDGAPEQPAARPDPDDFGPGPGEHPAPADEAAARATPAANNAPSGDPSNSDFWANAPADIRQAHELAMRDAELRFKSVQGRQSGADRELQRLRAENEQLLKGRQSDQGAAQEDEQSDSPDPFKQSAEDYPEIVGPFVEKFKTVQTKLDELEQGVGVFQKERENAFYAQQQELLAVQHPDWMDVIEDDRFGGWLQDQPLPVQEVYQRNIRKIADGREAAWLVGQFKAGVGIGQQAAPQQPSQQASRRAKQLASGRDFGSGSGSPIADGIPDDFDAAMGAFAEQADAKARRR